MRMRWALSFLLLMPVFGFAQEDVSLVKKYRETKSSLITSEEEKRKILSQLFKLTIGIKRINKRREHLMNDKYWVELKIKEANENSANLKVNLGEQRRALKGRLRALYKLHGQENIRVIFSSQSPAEMDRNLKILQLVTERDYRLIKNFEKNVKRYSKQKKSLERHMSQLAQIEKELKHQEGQLLSQQEQKNEIIKNLDEHVLSDLQRLERIKKQSSKVAKVLGKLGDQRLSEVGNSFFEQKGKLYYPLVGKVREGFGVYRDKRHRVRLRRKGSFIEAAMGTEVQSVYNGKVVFVGAIPTFGNTVIIDHGDHYFSVYANNAKSLVSLGDLVESRERIAISGSGQRFGRGSYFEVRYFSDPQDPKEWLMKKSYVGAR